MSDAIDAFKSAVEAEDEQQAIETAGAFLETLDRRSELERGLEVAARKVALDTSVAVEEQSRGKEIIEQIKAIESTRTTLAQDILALANGFVELDDTLATIEELERQKAELEEARDAFRATDAVQDLRPILLITATETLIEASAGSAIQTDIVIQNAGGTPATNVTIEPEDGIELTANPAAIDTLSPGDNITVELTGPDDLDPGRYRAKITAEASERAQDTLGFTLFVLSKVDYLEDVLDSLDEFELQVEDVLEDNRRQVRPFRQNIDKIRTDLQSLITDLNDGTIREQRANQRIEKNRQRLSALYGLINSLDRIRDAITASLTTDLDTIDDQLLTAHDVDL